jgi:putative ABC transport system permease protein
MLLRDLGRHPVRTAATLVAVAVAVSFVVAAWVAGDSVQRTLAKVGQRAGVDVAVFAGEGRRLTEADLAEVRRTPGITGVTPVTRGAASVGRPGGKLAPGSPELGGTSWTDTGALQVTDGRAPRHAGEVAVHDSAAQAAGLVVGDRAFVLLDAGQRHDATVVGRYAYQPLGVDVAPVVAFDPQTAHRLLGAGYSGIEVDTSGPANAVADRLVTRLPQTHVITGEAAEEDARRASAEQVREVRGLLLALAAVVLLVAALVIANVFTAQVNQRIRQFALLRAIGARRSLIRRLVLAEAALLGLVGTTVGVGLGVTAARAGVGLLAPAGETMAFAVSPAAPLVGYAVGVPAAIIAGNGAARRAGRVPPVAALREGTQIPARSLRARRYAGLVMLSVSFAAVALTAKAHLSGFLASVAVGGALLGWVAVLLLVPVLLPRLLHPLERLAVRVGAPAARMALRHTARDPRRSAATVSALMVGVTLVTALATVAETMAADETDQLRATLPAGTVVLESADGAVFGPDVVAAARAVPGAPVVLAARTGTALVGDLPFPLTTVDPAGIGHVVRPQLLRGRLDLSGGAILPQEYAQALRLDVGDQVALRVGDRTLRLPVTGLYRGSRVLDGILVAESQLGDALPARYHGVYLGTTDGSNRDAAATLRAAAERAFAGWPGVLVTDVDDLARADTADLRLAVNILYGLLLAAAFVAVFGVVNTLALTVAARRREFGTVRALGASTGLVRRIVHWEGVVLTSAGGFLGVLVGLGVGAVMQHALVDRPLTAMTVPWIAPSAGLAGALMVGLVAAWWPARRAAAVPPLAAVPEP